MSRYTENEIRDANTFARTFIASIEFSKVPVLDSINPFKIVPLVLDSQVPDYIKSIFSKIEYKNVPWSQVGIDNFPANLSQFPNAVVIRFTQEGCEELDCFEYADLKGKPCEEKNIKLEAMRDTPLVGCRPICESQFNAHVFYDLTMSKCRFGSKLLEKYCLVPALRTNIRQKGINDVPSFYFDSQNQKCKLTEAYCKGFEVMDFKDDDCYMHRGQKILEMFIGTNITRRLFMAMRNSPEYSKRVLEMKELKRRRESLSKLGIKHYDTVNKLLQLESPLELRKVHNQSLNQPIIGSVEKYKTEIHNTVGNLGRNSGGAIHIAGQVFGGDIVKKLLNYTTENIRQHCCNEIFQKFTGQNADIAVGKIAALFHEKSTAIVSAQVAIAVLRVINDVANPTSYIIDVLYAVSKVWDCLDPRFGVVVSKQELDSVEKTLIKQTNSKLGYFDENNKEVIDNSKTKTSAAQNRNQHRNVNNNNNNNNDNTSNNNKDTLVVLEITPLLVYQCLFGDLYSEGNRNAQKHQDTLIYYGAIYLQALQKPGKNEQLTKRHVNGVVSNFLEGISSIFQRNESPITYLLSLLSLVSFPLLFTHIYILYATLALIAVVIAFMLNNVRGTQISNFIKNHVFHQSQ